MRTPFAGVWYFLLGLMLFLPLLGGTAWAQAQEETQAQRQQVQPGNNAPVWREVRSGKEEYTSVTGRETGVLIQTEGQTWRKLRNGPITFYGGWLVGLGLIALGLFYKWRGPIGLSPPPPRKKKQAVSPLEAPAPRA